ncbi:MAG: PAS domain S-box protein [Opitutales bacterium]|nr:PAS domain S-box protein [Opitutales bacterium]
MKTKEKPGSPEGPNAGGNKALGVSAPLGLAIAALKRAWMALRPSASSLVPLLTAVSIVPIAYLRADSAPAVLSEGGASSIAPVSGGNTGPPPAVVRIGVLANRGFEICLREWGPTAAYLSDRLDEWVFEIVPLGFDDLIPAVRAGEMDFVSANPSLYAYLEYHGLARRILTIQMPTPFGPKSHFGGVILTLAEREDLHALTDLQGKRFAAVSPDSLGGWHAAWRELVKAGIHPGGGLQQVLFKGSHDAVVEAILSGQVDAGTVRSTQIERMVSEGLLDRAQLKVLGSRAADYPTYPYALSTRLYPEWPLAALAGTDPHLAKQVALALMQMEPEDEAAQAMSSVGWNTPEDYTPIRELLRDLRLPPFEDDGRVTFGQFIRQFWPWLIGLSVLAVFLLAGFARSYLLNRKLAFNERILESFFSQSLNGCYIFLLDKPIDWNAKGANKDEMIEYALDHQRMTRTNQAVLYQYGAKEGDLLGITLRELFQHDLAQARSITRELFDRGQWHTETYERKLDGSPITIEGDYICLYDGRGRIVGHFGVEADVTERKRLEEQLLEFKTGVEQAIDGIAMTDMEGNIRFVNNAWAQMHGRSVDELIGQHLRIFHNEKKMQEEVLPSLEKLQREGGDARVVDHVRKDGTVFPTQMTSTFLRRPNGEPFALLAVARDVSEKMAAEAALRESEKRFREILRCVETVSVQGYAMNGTVRYWNEASERFYGYTAEEAMGRNLLDLIIPTEMREAVKAEIAAMRATGKPIPAAELTLRRKDGSPVTVYSSHALVQVPGKEPEFYCIDVDLTDRKRMEDALRAAMQAAETANRAKSEFLANMSHEIRTPMNGVIGMTDLLMETELDPTQRHYAQIVQSSGNSLISLIDGILDFSKIEAGKVDLEEEPVHLPSLLKDFAHAWALQAREKGLAFHLVIDPALPQWVAGDDDRLRQILTNLVGNAIKFTETGTVWLRASLLARADASPEDTAKVRVEVEDTGIGISEEAAKLLFHRFSQVDGSNTRRYGGTGLGLAISKQLVGLMGGEIGAESRLGEGSTFSLTLPLRVLRDPLTEAPDKRTTPEKTEAAAEMPARRILLAEDNPTNQIVAKALLAKLDLSAELAENGQAVLQAHRAAPFDIILMDVQMPVMDGLEATRSIRADEKDTGTTGSTRCTIIGMTAHAMEEDRTTCLEAGMDDFIRKPVKLTELREALARHLHTPAR